MKTRPKYLMIKKFPNSQITNNPNNPITPSVPIFFLSLQHLPFSSRITGKTQYSFL